MERNNMDNSILFIIGIVAIVFVLVMLLKGDKKEVCDTCEPVEPVNPEKPCVVLKKLFVLYKGRFLVSGEVVEVPYNQNIKFEVKGFDITGTKEACINGSEVMWLKSCEPVQWEYPDGLTNNVLVNNKTVNVARNVWVKYSNGITFSWKVKVV
jgi:hypothetical protein